MILKEILRLLLTTEESGLDPWLNCSLRIYWKREEKLQTSCSVGDYDLFHPIHNPRLIDGDGRFLITLYSYNHI